MRKKLEMMNLPAANDSIRSVTQTASNSEMTMQFDQLNRLKAIFDSLSSNFATGEFVRVLITSSVSPDEFYVVKWQTMEAVTRLQSDLLNCYSSRVHATIAAPEYGVVCCVESEGVWFRAVVGKIGENATCEVRLIDSGSIIWAKWSKLCVLEERFARLPAYSAQCKLSNVKATPAQTNRFNRFCDSARDVYMLIHAKDAKGCCNVTLFSSDRPGEYQCINQTISHTEGSSMNNAIGGEDQTGLPASSNGRRHLHMIEILLAKSLDLLFVELEQDKAGIQRLLADVQRYACSFDVRVLKNCEWKMGDCCLVQVHRENKSPHYWYRSKIVGISQNGFEAYLRDEGVTVTVKDPLRIRPIDDCLDRIRDRAIRCRLSGIQAIQRHDVDDVTSKLMEIANQFDRIAISIHEATHDCTLPILLWGGKMQVDENLMLHFEWYNINRLLIDRQLAKPDENFASVNVTVNITQMGERQIAEEVENDMQNIEFVGDEIGTNIDFDIKPATDQREYDLSDNIQAVDCWLPPDKIFKSKYVATVTYVSTKCVIHVLDPYRRTVAEAMQRKITDHVNQQKTASVHNTDWITDVGQACFARFVDRKFYRASIRRICRENDYCLVRFIDYGNVEICKLKNIYPAVMFGDVPTLTQTYIFASVRPTYETAKTDELGRYRWPKAVLNYCYNNLVDRRCIIHVIDDFSDGINTCELFRGEREIEFGAKLVREEMACFTESFFNL